MVPHFHADMEVLVTLTAMELSPPNIPIQKSNDKALYIMGDALGSGFGLCQWVQNEVVADA